MGQTKDTIIKEILSTNKLITQLEGQQYLKDLYTFNTKVLKVEEGTSSVHLSPAHKDMCRFIDEEPSKYKLMLFPRGHLKSTLVTVGHSVRRICRNPKVRILIVNGTYGLAVSFLDQIKSHLKGNETLKKYYGDFSQAAGKWSEDQIKVFARGETVDYETKEPTVKAMGITGSLTSQHYDLIIGDDLVNRENITTMDQIRKVKKFYMDALDLLEPGGEFIIIGTRWTDGDLYGWIMEGEPSGDFRKDPEIPKEIAKFIMPHQFVYRGRYFNIMKRKVVEGKKAIWPEKFTPNHIELLKRQKGPYEFSTQYNNEPVAEEDQKFKRDWFKYFIDDDIKGRNLKYYTMCDPAISQESGSDYTVISTIAVDESLNWFVVEVIRERFLPSMIIEQMFNVFERWHANTIGIETVAYQRMLSMSLREEMHRRGKYLPLLELKPAKNISKNARIEALQPGYFNGRIFHKENMINLDYLEDELLRYPRGTHDDIIDTLAYMTEFASPPTPDARKVRRSQSQYLY